MGYKDKEQEMEEFKDITDMIRNVRSIQPPENFTDHVMKQLPDQYPGILLAAASVVRIFYRRAFAPDDDRSPGLTTRECSFYFFITGFFYLIIGIILMIGFKGISSSMAAMDWIRLQPHVTLGIAVWLIALGIVLLMEGKTTIKVIRLGTLFYIFLAIVNGVLMRLYFSIPYAGIFIFGFIGTGVLMGVMLALAVQKVELRMQ